MALTEEHKLENFKHILECFVATIEWIGNYKDHEAAARQFPGHAAYIQPHLDDGTMCYAVNVRLSVTAGCLGQGACVTISRGNALY